jgi:uncharacterized integral membrane protein
VQVIRTLTWIVITVMLVAFIAMNWERAPVNIWPLESSYLYFQWPVGVIALVFFLLGLVPMWLIHRATRWRLERRVSSLEHSVRATSAAPPLASLSPAPASPLPPASTTVESRADEPLP